MSHLQKLLVWFPLLAFHSYYIPLLISHLFSLALLQKPSSFSILSAHLHFFLSHSNSLLAPISRLVINAECCTLTIDLMHCGVCFLLCKVFNYTFPLLTVHVFVFEFYPATPRHCPDQFCLLRLRCIFVWKLECMTCQCLNTLPGNPGAPVDPVLVGSTVLA